MNRPATIDLPAANGALASLSLCALFAALGVSCANVALPTFAQAFDVSFQQVQWVVIAYLLAMTTLIVSVARLGDVAGRRRLLLAGIALFAAASLVGGVAPTLWVLIAARAGQGLGAAIMMALTMALVGATVPQTRTGSAMGLLGAMSAAGTALGPSLGGVLIGTLGWRAIFLVNLALALLTLALAGRYLPPDRPDPAGVKLPVDVAGTLLLVLALGAYALGMTLGRGTFGPLNAALLLAAACTLVLFVLAEGRAASPMIALSMLRDRALSASLAGGALVSTVMMATLVVGPFYLSRALALDAAAVGLVMAVGPVAAALAGVPAGRLADRFGAARIAVAGLAAGSVALSLMPAKFGVPGYLGASASMTVSYALFQTANNTAVMASASPQQRGVLSGLLNLSRNLGLITGASVMGALFAIGAASPSLLTAQPGAMAAGMRLTFGVAAFLIVLALSISWAGRRGQVAR
ncbi:MFS transporter [Massilia sp. TSP1-1-2]|uniref:MFS transporter n=1 Tax=Massilia sp. TSP1-1-2 TaxID=2804649 RepID=UPI003CF2607A